MTAANPLEWANLALLIPLLLLVVRMRHRSADPSTQKDPDMSQAFKDAFAAFQSAVAADKAKAVADAIAGEKANHQAEIDAATAAGTQAESDEDTAEVTAATAAMTPPPAEPPVG